MDMRTSAVCSALLLHATAAHGFVLGGAKLAPSAKTRASLISLVESDALTVLGGALSRISDDASGTRGWKREGASWLLLPPSVPWATIHFVGGAGFGSAPQLCYDAMLSSLVRRLGVAVIATPYDVGTDHWGLSRAVHRDFDAALSACREDCGLAASAPTFRLGHSLGAKLLVLGALGPEQTGALPPATSSDGEAGAAAAAAAQSAQPTAAAGDKIGLLAFNNFALKDSAELASNFLARLQGGPRAAETARAVMDAFNMAQAFATSAGMDFGASLEVSPTPQELDSEVAARYAAAETTLLRFEGDNLDSADGLLAALPASARASTRTLDGERGHLTPVVFRLDASEIDPALELILGSGRGFSFGSAESLEPLCDALCEWAWPEGMKPTKALSGAVDAEVVDLE